jgi:glycosyltransferase involved in cell wall biosynthesis
MRFHVLAVPHTITSEDYSACAFTQKVLKFCKMMTARGHTIYHYGHEKSVVDCHEHITVTNDELLKKVYGDYDWKKELFKHDTNDECHKVFNENASREIGSRKQTGDFLLMFWGAGHLETAKAHAKDLICIEPGIGSFGDVVTPFAVFESYAVMHHVYAKYNRSPRFMDAVIPNYFEELTLLNREEFEQSEFKDLPYKGYALLIGRIIASKGIQLAIEACTGAGIKLVIAGQGDISKAVNPDFKYNTSEMPFAVSHVGYISPKQRSILLSGAKCLLCPSLYAEPFGGTQVEAQMAGVPVVTTDWGAFTETVEHGVTGFRCRILEHFIWAIRNVVNLDSSAIKKRAIKLYGFEKVASMYEEYFSMILKIKDDKGFYSMNPKRNQLDWLRK